MIKTKRIMPFFLVWLLLSFFNVYAGEGIVICRMGEKDEAPWNLVKKHFDSKGYNVSIYEKTDNIDRQLENAGRINRTKASFMLAMDVRTGEKTSVFIAVTDAKKGKGRLLTAEEIAGQHAGNSMALAKEIAASYGKNVKELSLFPLTGVNMPGVFIGLECPSEQVDVMLNKLHEGIQKFLKIEKR